MIKKITIIALISLGYIQVHAQKNFIDQPYIETSGTADTLVTPDKIFIKIVLSETDSKNKISIESLEEKMAKVFKNLNIDVEKNLALSDLNSIFKGYFLKGTNVEKSKTYSLEVNNAVTAGKVMAELENAGIANVSIERTEYSKSEELINYLKGKAILKSKQVAISMATPLDQKIGKAIHIVDEAAWHNQSIGRAGMIMSSDYQNKSITEETLNSEFKKIKFQVRVNAKYQLISE